MSASDKGSNQDLFAEAHLPPSLNALVLDLGAKMSPLVKEAVEGKSYMIVECPAGAQLIRDIYKEYNEIFVKRSDSATQLLGRLGVNARTPPTLLILQRGTITLTPDDQSAIIIPTSIVQSDSNSSGGPVQVVIVEKRGKARHTIEWRVGASYCLSGKVSIEVLDASKVGTVVWKFSKRDLSQG